MRSVKSERIDDDDEEDDGGVLCVGTIERWKEEQAFRYVAFSFHSYLLLCRNFL